LSNEIPVIALYAAAALKLIPTASKIMISFQNLKFGTATISRVYEEVKIQNASINEKNYKLDDFKSIEFENVNYSYDHEKEIIKNASIKIQKGEFIGIVGQSGSGKTTLLNIILGLIPPQKGKILIDGKDQTKGYSNIRNLFSLVSQDVFLFDDNIESNISLESTLKNIDQDKLKEALKLSQLENFIKNSINNVKTNVGEKGISVSGGQKQRISIARALYRNSHILVLDEATSNLDLETEKKILDSLLTIRGKKTIICVSHRISSLKSCDKIYTIDQNKEIVEIKN
jgi:ABC-type bacteriocin/lantibiotic exporter with double-glycine peptidase domain